MMMTSMQRKTSGFTLIEILLVTVIVAMMVYGATNLITQRAEQARIDRTSIQMQQILNAAMSYYVVNGAWPDTIGCLAGTGCASGGSLVPYLGNYANNSMKSPWGGTAYTAGTCSDNVLMFCVSIDTVGAKTGNAAAKMIAGTLPMASATGTTVQTRINIPGQNLNNARAVNFAGLYHHGGCVPVPTCPTDPMTGVTMTPQIMVVPVQVSGVNDSVNGATSSNVYPISSFTAYATGSGTSPTMTPAACTNSTDGTSCGPLTDTGVSGYWRVCMQIVTELGDVSTTNKDPHWGSNISLMAITRCSVNNEASGSQFTFSTN